MDNFRSMFGYRAATNELDGDASDGGTGPNARTIYFNSWEVNKVSFTVGRVSQCIYCGRIYCNYTTTKHDKILC